MYKILNSKYRQLIKKNNTKQTFVQWLFVNCQVHCVPLRNYSIIENNLMSSKILTYNPAFFLCLPTDLFTKLCHIK